MRRTWGAKASLSGGVLTPCCRISKTSKLSYNLAKACKGVEPVWLTGRDYKMRKKRKTIILVKIRRYLRHVGTTYGKYQKMDYPKCYSKESEDIENIAEKIYNIFNNDIKELKHITEWQGMILKKFGDELRYFQMQEQNSLYEIKLKKYRDEILKLKREIEKLKK